MDEYAEHDNITTEIPKKKPMRIVVKFLYTTLFAIVCVLTIITIMTWPMASDWYYDRTHSPFADMLIYDPKKEQDALKLKKKLTDMVLNNGKGYTLPKKELDDIALQLKQLTEDLAKMDLVKMELAKIELAKKEKIELEKEKDKQQLVSRLKTVNESIIVLIELYKSKICSKEIRERLITDLHSYIQKIKEGVTTKGRGLLCSSETKEIGSSKSIYNKSRLMIETEGSKLSDISTGDKVVDEVFKDMVYNIYSIIYFIVETNVCKDSNTVADINIKLDILEKRIVKGLYGLCDSNDWKKTTNAQISYILNKPLEFY